MAWAILVVVVLSALGAPLATKALKKKEYRRREAAAYQQTQRKIDGVVHAIEESFQKPFSPTEHEEVKHLIIVFHAAYCSGTIEEFPEDDRRRAQGYVDLMLAARAKTWRAACARQNKFEHDFDDSWTMVHNRLSVVYITELSEKRAAIKKDVQSAKNNFHVTHSDASYLGFRVWGDYRDYLLLLY